MNNIALTATYGLEKIITELTNDLKRYVLKEGANERYIKKQNEILFELTDLYNQLYHFRYLEFWEEAESRMRKLEELDPGLNAHTIVIHIKPGKGNNYSFIEINPFRP